MAACSNLYGEVSSSNPADNKFIYFYTIKIIIQTINAYKKTGSHIKNLRVKKTNFKKKKGVVH
jgi:hypothetical protein